MNKIYKAHLPRRALCALLAALLLSRPPMAAQASVAASGTLTAAGYVVSLLLDACGISVSLSSLSSLIGSWSTLQEYEALGEKGQLGAFSQYLYGKTHSGDVGEALERSKAAEEALVDAMGASWGDTLGNLSPLLLEIKGYLSCCYGYGKAEGPYYVPAVPENRQWGVTGWSSREFFPLPTTPAALVPPMANDPSFTLFLTSYVAGYTSLDMNVQNWYYEPAHDVFGVYDAQSHDLETYERNAGGQAYRPYYCAAYSAYAYEDGELKYSVTSTDWWKRSTIYCSASDAGALPFPVFGSMADAMAYVQAGSKANLYVPDTLPLEVEGGDAILQSAAMKGITGALAIPGSLEDALGRLSGVSDAYGGDEAAVKSAIADAGLAIDWGIPKEDETEGETGADASAKEIVGAIDALPGSIADELEKRMEADGEEARKRLSLPSAILDKFPFCIPFDVAYLVSSLAAARETPVFEVPIKFDYLSFHYEDTFTIDFSDYDAAVAIFRVMLDLLFCAGLLNATRHLIRG